MRVCMGEVNVLNGLVYVHSLRPRHQCGPRHHVVFSILMLSSRNFKKKHLFLAGMQRRGEGARASSGAAKQQNRAFCDKSTKFGTEEDNYIINKSGYWAITDSAPDGHGSHFSLYTPQMSPK